MWLTGNLSFSLSIAIFICIGNAFSNSVSHLPKIEFYEEDDMSGNAKEVFASLEDVQNNDEAGVAKEAKSFCVRRGAWKLIYEEGEEKSSGEVKMKVWNAHDGFVCVSTCDKRSYNTIRVIGGPELNTAALTLYPDPGFEGERTFVTDTQKVFSEAMEFQSFAINGMGNWSVYNSTDFTGEEMCLGTEGFGRDSTIVTTIDEKPLWIASVKMGCSTDLACGLLPSGLICLALFALFLILL